MRKVRVARGAFRDFERLRASVVEIDEVYEGLRLLAAAAEPGWHVPFQQSKSVLYFDIGRFRILFRASETDLMVFEVGLA